MHRLFVALVPPPDVRMSLTAAMAGVEDARWQRDDQLHLTLAYLGEMDRHRANDVAQMLKVVRAMPIALALGAFGTFDAKRLGRVASLWIGVQASDALAGLASKVRRVAKGAGIEPDMRKFVPHITVARFPARGVMPEALARFLQATPAPCGAWIADEMLLFESTLVQGGAHYVPVERYPLR